MTAPDRRRDWFGQANPLTALTDEEERKAQRREPLIRAPGGDLSAPVGPRQANHPKDVKRVQRGLMDRGHMKRAEAASEAGTFGPATERATRAFQDGHGLKVDGLANPGGPTLTALSDGKTKEQKAPTPDPARWPSLSTEAAASNTRTVDALTRTRDYAPMAALVAETLSTPDPNAEAEAADLLGQFARRHAEGAQGLARAVDSRTNAALGTTLLALSQSATQQTDAQDGDTPDKDQDQPDQSNPPKDEDRPDEEIDDDPPQGEKPKDQCRSIETRIMQLQAAIKDTKNFIAGADEMLQKQAHVLVKLKDLCWLGVGKASIEFLTSSIAPTPAGAVSTVMTVVSATQACQKISWEEESYTKIWDLRLELYDQEYRYLGEISELSRKARQLGCD